LKRGRNNVSCFKFVKEGEERKERILRERRRRRRSEGGR